MSEVIQSNFKEKLPQVRKSLEKAKFVTIDLEFSALQPLPDQEPRLFDDNKERYAKLRLNLLNVIPVQVGITAFLFDNDTNNYFGEVFTFYVKPAAFVDVDKSFYFQSSTLAFLSLHKFDFNKFAYSGVSYVNSLEEDKLRERLKSDDLVGENCQLRCEFEAVAKKYVSIVAAWYSKAKTGDFLEIPDISNSYSNLYEVVYFMHRHLRNRFKNLWTYQHNSSFCVKIVTDHDFEILEKNCTLDENLLDDLIGFRQVFKLLTSLRKPIIGHNILQDLMIMMNNFEIPLPESYSQFKSLTHHLFPSIYDTKTLFYEMRPTMPKEKLPEDTSLKGLFNFFKDGQGRHLVADTTAIECNIDVGKFGNYHDAGWDSFCTGYIFLRMGYYKVCQNFPKSKKFVSSELFAGLLEYKNRVNLIRGATTHVRIDGEDPTSRRPPWLVVETLKNEQVDVSDMMSMLSSYGFVDIKRIKGKRFLVAVDNYRTAREISKTFHSRNPRFAVKQYNFLKHSAVNQALLLGALTVSGTILLWLTHTLAKR